VDEQRQLIKVAKALSDPTRFNILLRIASKDEISYGELANDFHITNTTVSHHLKILQDSGLVDVRRRAPFSFVRARYETLDTFLFALGKTFSRSHLSEEQANNIG
jgi:ArsR family transcriptional regulator, arsenate/arsenite/antimonite-responsive transcriptional repressor